MNDTWSNTWTGTSAFKIKADFPQDIASAEPTPLEDERYPAVSRSKTSTRQERTSQTYRHWGTRAQPHSPTLQGLVSHLCKTTGRQDAYKKNTDQQPVSKLIWPTSKSTWYRSATPILTAVDVQSPLSMAVAVPTKATHQEYMSNCLKSFILESGRTDGILQSNNEPTLKAILQTAAVKIGNMSVRTTPSYSSNSQGSVERYHRTLFGQVKALREHIQQAYNIQINNRHPLLQWIVRHSAWVLNRYLVHADGLTSYQRRWERHYQHVICELGATESQSNLKCLNKLGPRCF